jgi:glycosyltransferase involved in cell wall biosynthesis
MKIVFVSKECPPSPRSCGIGSYVWETGRALARVGHEVTIIAAADDGRLTSSEPSPGITVIRLPDEELGVENRNRVARILCAPLKPGIAYRQRIADCIANVIDRRQPDIVEFPGFRGESVNWLAGRRSLPMVARMHGVTAGVNAVWRAHLSATGRLQLNWEREELRAADLITVVAEHLAPAVKARFGADRVRVLYNSIDSDLWRGLSCEAPQEIGGNDILFVGSLQRGKGIFVLLRAADRLRRAGWRGRLVLAGRTSRDFERFVRLRAALGVKLPDWVVHLGVCRRERLAGLYRDSGVCCLPSLHEALNYTCLEAMACGSPVVGTLGTGMAEMLTKTCGFLVPPGDVSQLVSALRSALLMSGEERRRMKESALQRVRERFDHAVIIPQLLSVYSEAIDSYSTRAGTHSYRYPSHRIPAN